MDFITDDVQDKVKELIKLLLPDSDVSYNTVDRAIRMLRPASDGGGAYTGAIKQRIRQNILTHTPTGSNGLAVVSAFEKECDTLRRMDSPLLQPFLAVLEPLSYALSTVSQYGSRISITDDENLIYNNNSTSSSASVRITGQQDLNSTQNKSELPSMSYAIAGGLLPIVPPYHTSGVDIDSDEAKMAWISNDVENKLLKDLIYIFQVRARVGTGIIDLLDYHHF